MRLGRYYIVTAKALRRYYGYSDATAHITLLRRC